MVFSLLFAFVRAQAATEGFETEKSQLGITIKKWISVSRPAGRIVIPGSADQMDVVAIGDRAFEWCSCITEVSIPKSVKTIGQCAFAHCLGLTKIDFEDASLLHTIERNCFAGCLRLSHLSLPHHVGVIGEFAFLKCKALKTFVIPDDVVSIGDGAFAYCDSLEEFIVGNKNKHYSSSDGILYRKADHFVVQYPLGNRQTRATLEGSGISSYAVAGSSIIESVILSDQVRVIGARAFEKCIAIKSITFPQRLRDLHDYALRECVSLTKLDLGRTDVQVIGSGAIWGCKALESVVLPLYLRVIGNHSFAFCKLLKNIEWSTSISTIGDYAFQHCVTLDSLEIPLSVRTIGAFSFTECNSVVHLSFAQHIRLSQIGTGAFSRMSRLTSVSLPPNLATIPMFAFHDCTSLSTVEFGNRILEIQAHAFSNTNLPQTLTLPKSVDEIGSQAFDCTNIRKVTITGCANSAIDSFPYGTTITQKCKRKAVIIKRRVETPALPDPTPTSSTLMTLPTTKSIAICMFTIVLVSSLMALYARHRKRRECSDENKPLLP